MLALEHEHGRIDANSKPGPTFMGAETGPTLFSLTEDLMYPYKPVSDIQMSTWALEFTQMHTFEEVAANLAACDTRSDNACDELKGAVMEIVLGLGGENEQARKELAVWLEKWGQDCDGELVYDVVERYKKHTVASHEFLKRLAKECRK